jgi:hypothetical protein
VKNNLSKEKIHITCCPLQIQYMNTTGISDW